MTATYRRARTRPIAGDALMVAGLYVAFPASIFVYIGAGQAAAVATVGAALALMAAGWVIGR